MNDFTSTLPRRLVDAAKDAPFPLYVVGGSVRDYLLGKRNYLSADYDICAPVSAEVFAAFWEKRGKIKSVYKATGTMKIQDEDGISYEFSSFRSDKYVRGEHTPKEVFFTDDISLDATRRDFKANAVYYEIKTEQFVDPLNGRKDIENKILSPVKEAEKVFSEDGLRLMRLCRIAAQLNFTPTEECVFAARKNAALLLDVHPERLFTELKLLLTADEKFNTPYAHYFGLKLLEETEVLSFLIPELWKGKNLSQRTDFHRYDVLEHSLRCVKYSPLNETLRLAALLHDVGKIPCLLEQGNCHLHEKVGVPIAESVLNRLTAPHKQTEEVLWLISEHMVDYNGKMKEGKLRRYFVKNAARIPLLLQLKQADFSACKDDLSVAPSVNKWEGIRRKMQEEGAPLTLKELKVNGRDLLQIGIPPKQISFVLNELLLRAALAPQINEKEKLLAQAANLQKHLGE